MPNNVDPDEPCVSATADRAAAPPPPHRAPAGAPWDERPGDCIGPYRLLSILGEGGFGIVWLAERREPLVQRAALKILKPGMDSKSVIARFEQERQALAMLDHPNIARVFDAGATKYGRPYFVMEHVAGEPITRYCDRQNLTIRQRLALLIPVCEAMQHAHNNGIIHRDIKPSNILVMVKDGQPVPKVIDFGVAKAVSQTLTEKTIFTEQGQIIGTPEYMSPEQAEMGPTDIDARADVYSLGVVLYELLTGLLPFDPKTLRRAGYMEIQRMIREVDPPKPSTRLTQLPPSAGKEIDGAGSGSAAKTPALEIARHRQTRLDQLARELRRELDWIPLMAMRKDRTERYASPAALADDLRAYLDGRSLVARPPTVGYRLSKYAKRNGRTLAGAAVLLSLLASFAAYVMFTKSDHSADAPGTNRADARKNGSSDTGPAPAATKTVAASEGFEWITQLVPLRQLTVQPLPPDNVIALVHGSVLNKDELEAVRSRLQIHEKQIQLEIRVEPNDVARLVESDLKASGLEARVQPRHKPDRFDEFFLDIRYGGDEATRARIAAAAARFVLDKSRLQLTPVGP